MTSSDLEAFLWYGYLPKPHVTPVTIRGENSNPHESGEDSLTQLVAVGSRIWRDAIESCLTGFPQDVVVPLSGGLDSRAILAGLLEYVSPATIQTYTFGVPGTYDYDIGNAIARAAGTRHSVFDLNRYSYGLENLFDVSRRVDGRTMLFQHAPVSFIEGQYSDKAAFWVGFMGDPLAGSHLLKRESTSWDSARTQFARRNRYSHSVVLSPTEFAPEDCLPEGPLVDHDALCYDEQLDFAVRQECYVKPLVLLRNYTYCTPFLHPQWVDFILGVPRQYRQKQFLYKEILKAAYPRLFALPVKNNLGLPLNASASRRWAHRLSVKARTVIGRRFSPFGWRVRPGLNYIDFDRGLRDRADLKTVVYESIQDLKKRGVVDWIDVDNIWNRHQQGQGDHADVLTLLASLEINLKVRSGRVHSDISVEIDSLGRSC